ncbi:hypothetical protein M405DRAFT_499061 [Rhizopogon salebrosus TDB-379]|nr:hypothetical protein M405DRAFT_499061 [Rhizopogon salebrosus TDB-379]
MSGYFPCTNYIREKLTFELVVGPLLSALYWLTWVALWKRSRRMPTLGRHIHMSIRQRTYHSVSRARCHSFAAQ